MGMWKLTYNEVEAPWVTVEIIETLYLEVKPSRRSRSRTHKIGITYPQNLRACLRARFAILVHETFATNSSIYIV
jgi:hypothetical protein